jgi:hypothetical protein
MNLKTHIQTQPGPAATKGIAGHRLTQMSTEKPDSANLCSSVFICGRKESAVALVITLLMLAVITFLAIAFLSMTNRDRKAVTATLDVDTARSMSDAALARAQTEIIARMMAQTDVLSYDYTASHNYISASNFATGENFYDANNVNYDWFYTNGSAINAQYWAQNIGNLFYDPRPPVFVMTNGNLANPQYDFRFWVDINRNGRFETNGNQLLLDHTGSPVVPNVINFNNGEPEWIGVLKYPEYAHSPTNPFIGRYAFMALPIGKTLDMNYIDNYAKFASSGGNASITPDGFTRDEGVGSWELNLAAFLEALSPAMYQTNPNVLPYNYVIGSFPNTGGAFDDASQFLRFRYASTYNNISYPFSLNYMLGNPPSSELLGIDEYGTSPGLNYPFDFTGNPTFPSYAWPGTYNSNMFYDVQDLFDQTKTGLYGVTPSGENFYTRLTNAVSLLDTTNRYTMQRLLACIGTSSAPEYGVYVYSNFFTNSAVPAPGIISFVPTPGFFPPPSWLRTKVNINYDNTAQIQANQGNPYSPTVAGPYGPYNPMPTNLVPWTPLGFFTNAADLLLRSQVFTFTNYIYTNYTLPNGSVAYGYIPYNYLLATFGITNIPVYSPGNPGIVYNEQVHRMLQLAANIYAAANPVYAGTGVNQYQQPPVFRPQLGWSNVNGGATVGSNSVLYITNFVLVTNTASSNAYTQIAKGFYALTNPTLTNNPSQILNLDPNFWGIPWVVGAVKGLPAFDQYSYNNQVTFCRWLQFVRKPATTPGQYQTALPFAYTNQFYQMSISNICGMDAWNPYSNNFSGSGNGLYVIAYNDITITLTNNASFPYNWGTNIYATNYQALTNVTLATSSYWQANQFKSFLQTNFVAVPPGYYSESLRQMIFFNTNGGGFSTDTNQNTWPTHNWTVTVSNHLYYALFDGNPSSSSGNGNLLDFVNLGPFGSSFPIMQYLTNRPDQFNTTPYGPMWSLANTTDAGLAQTPPAVQNQIGYCSSVNSQFQWSVLGQGLPNGLSASQQYIYSLGQAPTSGQGNAATAVPYANYADSNIWMACDPLVHYTIGDLFAPSTSISTTNVNFIQPLQLLSPMTLSLGSVTQRYLNGINNGKLNGNMVFGDPNMTSANNWQFPTNLFPGVGWLGRVHRGTPWQTIYLKSDNPVQGAGWAAAANNTTPWVNSPYTYPTNDWSILDLFTAVPNDNAARGLLSVNQTNDAAWAAVFAGVIAITNINMTAGTGFGVPLNPTNDVYFLMDATNGINAVRALQPNGIFHKIGDILQAPALTANLPYVTNFIASGGTPTDEMVERIPQQTLSLLKLGLPQFVIYSWGQSLKPKNLYSSGSGSLLNICTNYEITGEFLTRTVCHIVSDPGAAAPKIVIDNYNIEPGN